ERRDARVGLHRHHHAVAAALRDVADRATERRATQRSPVEVVDALVDGLLDHARVGREAAADAEPRSAQPGLTESDWSAEIGHRSPLTQRPRPFPREIRDRGRIIPPPGIPSAGFAPPRARLRSSPDVTFVERFDPLDPEVIADPYPWYRWLLREAPVYH